MDTNQRDPAGTTGAGQTNNERERDALQREEVDAQVDGDTGRELKAFAKEVIADQKQFPGDVVEDSKDPGRRVDEAQGTATQPGSEPAEDRSA